MLLIVIEIYEKSGGAWTRHCINMYCKAMHLTFFPYRTLLYKAKSNTCIQCYIRFYVRGPCFDKPHRYLCRLLFLQLGLVQIKVISI